MFLSPLPVPPLPMASGIVSTASNDIGVRPLTGIPCIAQRQNRKRRSSPVCSPAPFQQRPVNPIASAVPQMQTFAASTAAYLPKRPAFPPPFPVELSIIVNSFLKVLSLNNLSIRSKRLSSDLAARNPFLSSCTRRFNWRTPLHSPRSSQRLSGRMPSTISRWTPFRPPFIPSELLYSSSTKIPYGYQ